METLMAWFILSLVYVILYFFFYALFAGATYLLLLVIREVKHQLNVYLWKRDQMKAGIVDGDYVRIYEDELMLEEVVW